jgi:hypothetical protein
MGRLTWWIGMQTKLQSNFEVLFSFVYGCLWLTAGTYSPNSESLVSSLKLSRVVELRSFLLFLLILPGFCKDFHQFPGHQATDRKEFNLKEAMK